MRLLDDIIITGNRAIAKSYAKINLTLDVLNRLENGYHSVCMVMQSLNLFDLVTVEKASSGICVSSNVSELPSDANNIAYKAAELFFEKIAICGGAKIELSKNIPIAAGLAGGSGNAAAVLCALNILYNARLSDQDLDSLALALGADVPYCLTGGTQLAEGIGEQLTVLPPIKGVPVLLVKPDISISTGTIYKKIDSATNLSHPDTDEMITAISDGNIKKIASLLSNVMETVTAGDCPQILEIQKKMLDFGALGAAMSGSGPTVFGIFPDNASAKAACDAFSADFSEVFLTHTTE